MAELCFYLDENVPLLVAHQLRLSGIDVVAAHDLGRLDDDDRDHLARVSASGRSPETRDKLGGWARGLRSLHVQWTSEEATRL